MSRAGNYLCASLALASAWNAQTPAAIVEPDHLAAARSYAQRGLLHEAEGEVRQSLSRKGDSAPAHFLLGLILFRQTKARESLAEYTEGAKYGKPESQDLRVVGSDYVLLGDYADADKWFTQATAWDPQNTLGWYYLGRTKYNENRFEEAIHAFERCLQLEPRHVKAEDNLGLCLQALGRYDAAKAAFQNAVEWQSATATKEPWPYLDLGSFYLEINQPANAIPELEQALAIDPDLPKAHAQMGKAYLLLGQWDKAQPELEKAVQLAPENAQAHYVLGQLYQKRGQAEKAKYEFSQYARLNASHSPEQDREFRGARN